MSQDHLRQRAQPSYGALSADDKDQMLYIQYPHHHWVVDLEKKWLSEEMFAELLGISSALPGPASTQLAYTVALIRDGLIPAIWAFFIWSVPGGIIMTVFGLLIGGHSENKALPQPVLFCSHRDKDYKDNHGRGCCAYGHLYNGTVAHMMAFGGLTTYGIHLFTVYSANDEQSRIVESDESAVGISVHEPLLPNETPSNPQSSSLLLRFGQYYFSERLSYVVEPGWASSSDFLLGLAIINTLPGHFPAMIGALLAWIGMFTPGLLIKTGVLPLWKQYRGFPTIQNVFRGVNAAAVGLVLAATYLLSQRAISIANGGDTVGPLPVGKYPLYVALVGITFVTVAF
ncbi:hypothetical protein DFJ77DRAFT_524679 [Powellomyces hirtus]|nr:hypothetical protein DFJ77DRAFT_524679 [Powellomyces hirtus]